MWRAKESEPQLTCDCDRTSGDRHD